MNWIPGLVVVWDKQLELCCRIFAQQKDLQRIKLSVFLIYHKLLLLLHTISKP